jgi:hypothetical protein
VRKPEKPHESWTSELDSSGCTAALRTHNPKVAGSNAAPATKKALGIPTCAEGFLACLVLRDGSWSDFGLHWASERESRKDYGQRCKGSIESSRDLISRFRIEVPTSVHRDGDRRMAEMFLDVFGLTTLCDEDRRCRVTQIV